MNECVSQQKGEEVSTTTTSVCTVPNSKKEEGKEKKRKEEKHNPGVLAYKIGSSFFFTLLFLCVCCYFYLMMVWVWVWVLGELWEFGFGKVREGKVWGYYLMNMKYDFYDYMLTFLVFEFELLYFLTGYFVSA